MSDPTLPGIGVDERQMREAEQLLDLLDSVRPAESYEGLPPAWVRRRNLAARAIAQIEARAAALALVGLADAILPGPGEPADPNARRMAEVMRTLAGQYLTGARRITPTTPIEEL